MSPPTVEDGEEEEARQVEDIVLGFDIDPCNSETRAMQV